MRLIESHQRHAGQCLALLFSRRRRVLLLVTSSAASFAAAAASGEPKKGLIEGPIWPLLGPLEAG